MRPLTQPCDGDRVIGPVTPGNYPSACSACLSRRLTVAACTPKWSAISANRYPYCRCARWTSRAEAPFR